MKFQVWSYSILLPDLVFGLSKSDSGVIYNKVPDFTQPDPKGFSKKLGNRLFVGSVT